MSIITDKYCEISTDLMRRSDFTSNAVERSKRVYKLWNSNIKTLNTYYGYLDDVLNHSDTDNHHKKKILENLNLFSKEENKLITARQKIMMKVYKNDVVNNNEYLKMLILFFLSLNSKYPVVEGSEFVMDTLPSNVFSSYFVYLENLIAESVDNESLIKNPIFMTFVLFSDEEILDAYMDSLPLKDNDIEFLTQEMNDSNSMLFKRVKDCQKGSFRNEAIFGGLYYTLCEVNFHDLHGYENIIDEILFSFKQKIKDFDPSSRLQDSDWDELKKILYDLEDYEKEVFLQTLGNISVSFNEFKRNPKVRKATLKEREMDFGEDVFRTAKQRRGQAKFRKRLLNDENHKGCRICGCPITEDIYLKASHILEWGKSSDKEKVDEKNGFLLCPSHDFLFDKHLISFEDDGKILISKFVDSKLYDAFNLSDLDRIDLEEGNLKYLKKHRDTFNKYEREK